MTVNEWQSFLREASILLLAHDSARELFTQEQHMAGDLRHAGATDAQIAAAEARLGVTLPPSYRAFLRASNGFPKLCLDAQPGRLWAVEELFWVRDQDPFDTLPWGEMGADLSPEDHLRTRDSSVFYRREYVDGLLSVSDEGDSTLFLSPEVVNENGEWECWQLATWLQGAGRSASFADWMRDAVAFSTKS